MISALRSALLAVPILTLAGTAAMAQDWTVDPEASTLTLVAIQTNEEFDARFEDFTATITLDPEDLSDAAITVTVQTGSFASGAGDRDEQAPSADWFDTGTFPEAVFVSDEVTHVEGNDYVASGTLTIKGVEQPLDLPFTLEIEGDSAVAEGSIALNRMDYNVGVGEWSDGIFVGFEVVLTYHIEAQRAD